MVQATDLDKILYPDSDGEPLSDNTEQFEWITLIKSELEAIFKDNENVFIAGDLLWYPVKGDHTTRRAPDTMVAVGRPKGYRGSYKQWEENDIAPQVVFEILSPKNTSREMKEKLAFYDLYGVEEYYEYDPARKRLRGWRRVDANLSPIAAMSNWVSPRLQIRFELPKGGELKLYRPDGQAFRSFVELDTELEQERQRAELAEQQSSQAQQRASIAEQRTQFAEQQIERERQRAELAEQQAAQNSLRLERLLAKLRTEGIKPDEA